MSEPKPVTNQAPKPNKGKIKIKPKKISLKAWNVDPFEALGIKR